MLTTSSVQTVLNLCSDNPIQHYIEAAQNEFSPREERFYLGRILEKIPQQIAARRGWESVPEDLQYTLQRVKELREEFGESRVQGLISSVALRALQNSSSHHKALSTYISRAIKDPAICFLSPLPKSPRKPWSPFLDRVKRIAEEIYEDPAYSEHAVQVVAGRVLEMQSRLSSKEDQLIRAIFVGNLRDFRIVKEQQKIDGQMKKARELAQQGLEIPGKSAAFCWKRGSASLEITNEWEWGAGVAHAKGDRKQMEDTHLIGMIQPKGAFRGYAKVYAIFDGHGGPAAAKFAQQHLISYLQYHLSQQDHPHLSAEGNIFNALKLAMVDLGEGCKNLEGESGTTAALAMRVGKKLYLVNVGDSRILINSNKLGLIQATEDAELAGPRFREGVEKRGGNLETFGTNVLRVSYLDENGGLNMARALGDKDAPGITARPKIVCFDMEELGDESYMIIACDGLFEMESSKTVLERAARLQAQEKNHKEIAAALVKAAYEGGSRDNLSVLVVPL